MDDLHGYLPRIAEARVEAALRVMRVVVLTGARQTGKTTLARRFGDRTGRRYMSLDSTETLDVARRSPARLWEHGGDVTIDEVQREPGLLLEIKRAVDADPRKGRFLLTGSANLLLARGVSDGLAGRAAHVALMPMTWGETTGAAGRRAWDALAGAASAARAEAALSRIDRPRTGRLAEVVLRGGLPETLRMASWDDVALWRDGYVETYLERDLRLQAQVADVPDFLRLMRIAAARTGAILNVSGLAREAGLSVSTCRRWLNVLAVCFQARAVPAFTASRTRRLVKAPRLHWMDSGMACHLAGLRSPAALEASPLYGAMVETFAVQNVAALGAASREQPGILYWRTASGIEVDLVLETSSGVLPVEIKAGRKVTDRDAAGLRAFMSEHPKAARTGAVLYGGTEVVPLGGACLAVPMSLLFAG